MDDVGEIKLVEWSIVKSLNVFLFFYFFFYENLWKKENKIKLYMQGMKHF